MPAKQSGAIAIPLGVRNRLYDVTATEAVDGGCHCAPPRAAATYSPHEGKLSPHIRETESCIQAIVSLMGNKYCCPKNLLTPNPAPKLHPISSV